MSRPGLLSDAARTTPSCTILTYVPTRHSATAIANYVSTFTRCAQLARRDLQPGQIAFLLRRSRKLVKQYIDLLRESETDKNMAYHLAELLRLGQVSGGKK